MSHSIEQVFLIHANSLFTLITKYSLNMQQENTAKKTSQHHLLGGLSIGFFTAQAAPVFIQQLALVGQSRSSLRAKGLMWRSTICLLKSQMPVRSFN
ncbi:MAG: hypothetical protein ACAF41_15750 [Leptolyngbya sp. BL-A-14]